MTSAEGVRTKRKHLPCTCTALAYTQSSLGQITQDYMQKVKDLVNERIMDYVQESKNAPVTSDLCKSCADEEVDEESIKHLLCTYTVLANRWGLTLGS